MIFPTTVSFLLCEYFRLYHNCYTSTLQDHFTIRSSFPCVNTTFPYLYNASPNIPLLMNQQPRILNVRAFKSQYQLQSIPLRQEPLVSIQYKVLIVRCDNDDNHYFGRSNAIESKNDNSERTGNPIVVGGLALKAAPTGTIV